MGEEEKNSKGTGRFVFAGIFILAAALVCVLRLTNWQILNHSKWLKTADQSDSYKVSMDAARGEILDSKGNGLVVNKTGYAIQFNAATMTDSTQNKTILTLIKLLNSRKEKWDDVLPIKINAAGKYEFISGEDKEISFLKSKDCLNVNSYATAAECMQQLEEKYDCKGYSAQDARSIVSVRYNMTKSGFSVSLPYTFASGISQDTIAIMSENSANMPGVDTKVTTIRQYPDGALMPQILGMVGAISQEEYDELHTTKGYALNARLGKSGIEQAFEDYLRGKTGEKTVNLKTDGSFGSETVTKQPTSGDTVYLTIDSNLQKVVNASLAKNVKATQANGRLTGKGADCVGGAAVVLRVKDFAILAASTYPSYDQNQYTSNTSYYNQLLKDTAKPLFNRAFNGSFTPGSIFKPSVALAALQEGAITNSTVITCHGAFDRYSDVGLTIKCMGYHGPITLPTALAKSCNTFFCETGYRTGITAMNLYAKRLGLGVKTGIEINESAGILAGPAERKASGGTWNYGSDDAQAAIGQSDNMITPLQLATYCATIANNGIRLKPHLVDKITDYTRTKVIKTTPATEVDNIGVSQQNIDYVKAGMREVAIIGTARTVFANYGIAVAGKTGTGQTGNGSDNVTFIGFAPYDNPQIAIAVALEHGATSLYSNSVAKDIFDAYFRGATVDASGNIVIPSASSAASSGSSSASSAASSKSAR